MQRIFSKLSAADIVLVFLEAHGKLAHSDGIYAAYIAQNCEVLIACAGAFSLWITEHKTVVRRMG